MCSCRARAVPKADGLRIRILDVKMGRPKGGRFENSIAFGKSTSQRIYPKQHTPKIG